MGGLPVISRTFESLAHGLPVISRTFISRTFGRPACGLLMRRSMRLLCRSCLTSMRALLCRSLLSSRLPLLWRVSCLTQECYVVNRKASLVSRTTQALAVSSQPFVSTFYVPTTS